MLIGLFSAALLVAALALIVRVLWESTRNPLQPMTAPSPTPFLRRNVRQAIREHRRVWIKYRESHGEVIERTVEIYQTTLTGHFSGWCPAQRCRSTFRRDRILAWQFLNEQFKRSDGMQGWSRWQGWYERLREFRGTARGH